MTTILIVDDEKDMRELIAMMLNNSNFKTFTANGGTEAYAILAKEQVDLVLLDVMMPNENGFQVCTSIQSMPVCRLFF